jgi:hypothetical protein
MHIIVDHAILSLRVGQPHWELTQELIHDDGTSELWTHYMPADILEWRVAEYGWHPVKDIDTMLEIVIYEPWITNETLDPDRSHMTAPTLKDARDHQLERLAITRGDGTMRGRKGPVKRLNMAKAHTWLVRSEDHEDPLDVIKKHSQLSTPHIKVKTDFIRKQRDQYHRRRMIENRMVGAPTLWTRETPEELQRRLEPPKGNR